VPPGPILTYRPRDLPDVVPVFPLTGVILLPRGRLPLNIFEPRYLAMIDDAMAHHRLIGMIQPEGSGSSPGLSRVGGLGRITSLSETEDGRYLITLTGITRFEIAAEMAVTTPYRQIQPRYEAYGDDLAPPKGAIDRQALLDELRRYLDANKMRADWSSLEEAEGESLVNALAMICPFEPAEKQALIEAPDLAARADTLRTLLAMAQVAPVRDKPSLQ